MKGKIQEVTYVKLVGEQKATALEILGRGNRLLKKWSQHFPVKKYRQFRNIVMGTDASAARNPVIADHKIPKEKIKEFVVELPLITAIKRRYECLGNRNVEEVILQGFAAMAKQHARKWAIGNPTEGGVVGLTLGDYLQEAYMQVIESMYSWLPEHNVEIGTYIWWGLKNRMSNVTNQQGNMFCPLTNDDLSLYVRYEQAKREMSTHEKVTFDQIVKNLGLTPEEGKTLTGLLTQIYSENRLNHDREEDEDSDNDYTGARAHISKVGETEIADQQQIVIETLNSAGLNELERDVMEAALNPYHGWQIEFANNHINPTTNKPYSRMRITQVLQDAREKVKKVMVRNGTVVS